MSFVYRAMEEEDEDEEKGEERELKKLAYKAV
jgi:hypothetical protein